MTTGLLAAWWLAGCTSGNSGAPLPASGAASAAAPPGKTVFDPLTEQLGRARDVQNTVDAGASRTRAAAAAQERGDSTP